MSTPPARPWSVPIRIEDVPEDGRHFDLVPDENTVARIAKVAGVVALPHVAAQFDVRREGRFGLRVTGHVSAVAVQTCVVTLEPIRNAVEEAVDVVFAAAAGSGSADAPRREVRIDVADTPEPMSEGTIDLGAVATEFLILGIDPYPRKPGAVFEQPMVKDPQGGPFAALGALKKDASDGDR